MTSCIFLTFQAQKRELEVIRQNYRKNSLARSPSVKKSPSQFPSGGGTSAEGPSHQKETVMEDDGGTDEDDKD